MFKGLSGKLQNWQEAGLISADQLGAITAFEKQRKAGKLTRDLGRVGIIAILLGMISLVASNWDAITPTWKIIGHFILNLLVAATMLRIDGTAQPFRKDAALALLAGLFLSFIALIGQIFQLHGDIHTTLLFWLAIITPFIWIYGRSIMIAAPWLSLAIITLYMNIAVHFDDTSDRFWVIASLIAFYLPPLLLITSSSTILQKYKQGFTQAFVRCGVFLPAIFANIAIILFYHHERATDNTTQILLFVIGLIGIFLAFRPKPPEWPQQYLRCYLLASGTLIALPFILSTQSDLVPLFLFMLYWAFMAWLGTRIDSDNLVNWSIRLIILRLFIAYLEVFGNLLTTGIGLIISGILLLVILRYLNHIVTFGRKLLNHDAA